MPAFVRPARALLIALWALGALLLPGLAHAQRVALLIGNAAYQAGPLRNPPNDVRELEGALSAIGFKVQKVLNANQNQMKRALRDFGAAAQGAEVALLYYSGHATQVSGENYLLPVGATIEKEADYEVEAVSANAALRQIAGARPKAAIVVLDACRDNPHASATRSASKGLGRMDAPTGTAIAFATAPNTTASDDGHYARVLAQQLRKPGQELFDVFRNTSAEVRRLSRQEPRVSEWSIIDRIYLAGPLPGASVVTAGPVAEARPAAVVAALTPPQAVVGAGRPVPLPLPVRPPGVEGAKLPVLSRDELRQCQDSERAIKASVALAGQGRQALDNERKVLMDERQALQLLRPGFEASQRRATDELAPQIKALSERIVAYNQRNEAFKSQAQTGPAADAARAELRELSKNLEQERNKLDAEKLRLKGLTDDFNQRGAALEKRVADWNLQNTAFQEHGKAIEVERSGWTNACADRRYKESDEVALARERGQ